MLSSLRWFGRADADKRHRFLVYGGATGWIGQKVVAMLRDNGYDVHVATARLQARESVKAELDRVKPDFVINAAGLTGRPNVDWCEDHAQDTVLVNVIGTLSLLDACWRRDIHVTNFATGCLYASSESTAPFGELDAPNFDGSLYSRTKGLTERLALDEAGYNNVLQLRLRMPISDDLHPRSFVTKITRYERVVNIPNSVTVLHELLPVALDMALRRLTGRFNFVNPGAVSHNQVLALYKKHVNASFEWKNFTLDEQSRILKAGRSNCELDTRKLLAEYPDVPDALTALEGCMRRMSAASDA